jgi:hypothetical protein
MRLHKRSQAKYLSQLLVLVEMPVLP